MKIKVADEVWIATARLHQEQPKRQSFSVGEIVDRVRQERLTDTVRPGVQVHAYLHCVANKRPNPANHRMLYATPDGNRRLFRKEDDYHEYREGGKTHPDPEELPESHRHLVQWYLTQYYTNTLREQLADLGARVVQKFEQKLPVLRESYDELDADERARLREWLEKVVAAGDPPVSVQMRPLVEIDRTFHTDEGEAIEEGVAQFSPQVMLRALETWDKGELFTPGPFGTV